MEWVLLGYVTTGMIAGVCAGLFGISGGVITIPCLLFLFHFGCVPCPSIMQLAIGTSLASMTFNALLSAYLHHRRGAIIWKVVRYMVIGLVLGAVVGAKIADLLPSLVLKRVFGGFECLIGAYYFSLSSSRLAEDTAKSPKFIPLSLTGGAIGTISAMLGIGGGMFTVPALTYFRISIKRSIATSSACSFIITFIGAISFITFGLAEHANSSSFGYIYLPAFIPITAAALLSAPVGVKLAHNLPVKLLKKVFALLLVIIGIVLLIS